MTVPRCTIRRLMAAVAILGIFLGSAIEGERRRRIFEERAEECALHLLYPSGSTDRLPSGMYTTRTHGDYLQNENYREAVEFERRLRLYHQYWEQRFRKYEWACKYPWLPVRADPPEPPQPRVWDWYGPPRPPKPNNAMFRPTR